MAMSTTLLAPKRRLLAYFPRVELSVARRLNILMLCDCRHVYGIDLFLGALNKTLLMPLSVTILQSAIASVVFQSDLLIAILRTPFRAHQAGRKSQP